MEKSTFMAGAAKGEITPAKELMPMPLIFVIQFSEVLDPVYVRVLAMSDGKKQSMFVAFEMTLVPNAEETLRFIMEHTGLPKENIFLCATHTHGTPPVSLGLYKKNSKADQKCQKWYARIKQTLLATIRKAQQRMVPAKYGYGTGKSYFNVNRDGVYGEISKLGINYDRPSDKTIRMVRIEDYEGKTIALLVNYACHAVVMNGCLKGLRTPLTGDFPGRTCAKLERKMKDAVVLWCSGAAGDQNPWIMSQCGMLENGKYRNKNIGKTAEVLLEHISREHVRDILEANEKIICDQTDGSFYGAEKIVRVEPKEAGKEKVPYMLRLFSIGDMVFQGISAEIVTSVGKAVRETSPCKNTILVSHALGYQGYVADDWEYEHNAFEVGNSPVAKGAAQKAFVEGFTQLFKEREEKS